MWAWLQRFVDLRPGERWPVAKSAAVLFLVIGAHTLLETARDALFLEKLPAHRLAVVYAMMAVLSFLFVRITQRFVFRFGRRNAFIFTLMAVAYGSTVLYLSPSDTRSVYLLYVFTGLEGTLLTLQFWLMTGSLFTVGQGKRLFGPLAAGGVLGAVAAASGAAMILAHVPVRALLLGASVLFLLAATVLSTVRLEDVQRRRAEGSPRESYFRWETFRGEPYVRRLAGFVIAVTAAVLLTDYLFKWSAAALIPKADLGTFFATYYAVLNTLSLIVQVLLSGYLVRRLGVVSAILVLPLLVATGAAGAVVLGGAFLAVMFTKGVDGSLRHSLHRVSTELLWMPVGSETREIAKSVVDSVFVRLTQAATAGFILVVSYLGYEDPRLYAGFVTGIAAIAIGLGLSMRKPYLDLFRTALGSKSLAGMDVELDLRSVEVVVEALSSRDPGRVLAAIELLENKGRQRLIPGLILYHDSEAVLLRALEVITVDGRQDWISLTERLLSHESPVVRAAAVRALARAGHWNEALEARLFDISPVVRAYAAYWRLANESGAAEPLEDAHVAELLRMEGEAGVEARMALLEAIADGAHGRWTEVLRKLSLTDNPREFERAANAMRRMPDPGFIPILIDHLAVRAGRAAVRSAIEAHGESAQAALEVAFDAETTDPRVRLHIPRSLGWFQNQRTADFLSVRLGTETDQRVADKLLRSLQRLTAEAPVEIDAHRMESELRRNLVQYFEILALANALSAAQESAATETRDSGALILELLNDKRRQALERALLVLGTLHRGEDFRPVLAALESSDARARAQAAEFLDGLIQSSKTEAGAASRELLRVLADDLDGPARIDRVREHLGVIPRGAEDALRVLMADPREPEAALAVHHALLLDVPALREDARRIAAQQPVLIPRGSKRSEGPQAREPRHVR